MEVSLDTSKWKINPHIILGFVIGIAFVAVLIYLGSLGSESESEERIQQGAYFWSQLGQFGLQGLGLMVLALGTVFLTNAVRSCKWFDGRGPGVEMGKIRDRVMGKNGAEEKPGDNIACAMQWVSGTVLLAVYFLSYFMAVAR